MASFLGGLVGGTIGDALVKLRLDSASYESELAAQKAKTSAATDSMGSSAAKFGAAAKVGFALAATAALKFGADSVASFRESQEVLAQLSVAVGGSTEAYERQATALQNLTGFQDEEILKADTVLARFKLTGEQVRQLTPLVLDYARATGKDATSAAEAVGKALLGNARALKEIGIDYKATGDAAQDYSGILDALTEKVGGSAAAFAETYSGKLAILAARFDDLKESVGARLLGPMEDLLAVFESQGVQVSRITELIASGAVSFEDYGEAVAAATRDQEAWVQGAFAEQFRDVEAATIAMTRAAMEGSYAQAALAESATDATDAIRAERNAFLALTDPVFGVIDALDKDREAEDALHDARRRLDRLTEQGKEGTKAYAQAQRDVEAAALDAAEAHAGLLGAVQDLRSKVEEGTLSQDAAEESLRKMAKAAGLTKGETQALVKELHAGTRALQEWNRTSFEDKSATVAIQVLQNGMVAAGGGHQLADGGIVAGASGVLTRRANLMLVGEGSYHTPFGRGAEAVMPLNDATMDRLGAAIARHTSSGDGGTWRLIVPSTANASNELDRYILSVLARASLQRVGL